MLAQFCEVMGFFLRPENGSIWAQVQALAQEGDDEALHAYVVEAQRLTSSQRNVRVATQPAELEGKPVQPGNLVVMMLVSPHLVSQRCVRFLTPLESKGRGWAQPIGGLRRGQV